MGILLSLPAFVLVVALLGIPILQAVYYSMTNWDGLTTVWVGPETYVNLFLNPTFWRVLLNNGLLLLSVPFAIVIPLGIAAVLHEHVLGWRMVGTNTIIFLTGMATLDPSLHEAARMDGAGPLRVFLSITTPQLKPFIQFAFIMSMITAFTALFSLIFVMTGGGPGYGTTTLEFFVYQTAFSRGAFGTGALLGVVLFVIMGIVGLLQLKLLRSRE